MRLVDAKEKGMVLKKNKMIHNKSTKKAISQNEIYCKSIFSQARGLMFRGKQNLIMEFPEERKISLHMWFVFFPIDVLILNKDKKIVEIKRNFKPFTFWTAKEKGKYVVELGFPENYGLGDGLEFRAA